MARKAGQPTKYKEEYCDLILELSKSGKMVAQWASEIGVSKQSIFQWRKDHKEFSYAYDKAQDNLHSWCYQQGQILAIDPSATSTQLGALKWLAGAGLKLRENDSKEEIKDEISKQLPRFVNISESN